MTGQITVLRLLRSAARTTGVLTVLLFAAQLFVAIDLAVNGGSRGDVLGALIPAFAYWTGGMGIACVIAALREVLQTTRRPENPQALGHSLDELNLVLTQLRATLERVPQLGTVPMAMVAPMPTPTAEALQPEPSPVEVTALLAEIRDLLMLSEAERQAKALARDAERRRRVCREAQGAIESRRWPDAEQLLKSIDPGHSSDGEISRLWQALQASRAAAETEAAASVQTRVEDLMAISAWDEALTAATEFAGDFPHSSNGQHLLARVIRERLAFRESTVHRLHDEIRQDVDHRRWRRALAGAQRLLERFGDHTRADKIRQQLRTIQDNAEIEERQEQEARIQQLIKSKRYGEAIDLGEDLLRRFPASPQAQSLSELLPKLRGFL